MGAIDPVTLLNLIIAALGLAAASAAAWWSWEERRDRRRYAAFLLRVHKEAVENGKTVQTSFVPVTVNKQEIDLALQALAQGFLRLDGSGGWQCEPNPLIREDARDAKGGT